MGYATKYLNAHGQTCTIQRTPAASSYVSLRQSSKRSINPGTRESMWEGLILAASGLQSGEILAIGSDRYLVQSVNVDAASGEIAWFGAKTNTELTHQRYVETVDEGGNLIQTWATINASVAAFGQIVTAELRQTDPGLLDSCRYVYYVPSGIAAQVMDRLVMNGSNYQVEAIDDVMLPGVTRIQAGSDNRI